MKSNDIIDCGLPLSIQKLYIKRLKHMIERWEYDNFCGHCPINRKFESKVPRLKVFKGINIYFNICRFCKENVETCYCPCVSLKRDEALKRAKDFIKRFEASTHQPIP